MGYIFVIHELIFSCQSFTNYVSYNDDILIDRTAVDMLSDMQHVPEQNLHKICIVYIQFFPNIQALW
jgi:hypothetical protein